MGKYFDKRRGLANGLVMSGGSLGALLLPILLQYLFDEYGLRGSLIIIAGLSLNNLVLAAFLRPTTFYGNKNDCEEILLKEEAETSDNVTQGLLASPGNEKKILLESNVSVQDSDGTYIRSGAVSVNSIPNVYASLGSLPIPEEIHHSNHGVVAEEFPMETGIVSIIKTQIKHFLKQELLRNPLLYISFQGGLLISSGVGLVGIYLAPHARDLNIDETNTAILISIIGGMDFIGRVSYSFLSETTCLERYQLMAATTILTGALTNCIGLFTEFWSLCIFAAVYGILGGAYYVLYTSILTDFLGVEHLRVSLGIMSITHGLSIAAFYPILGEIFFYIIGSEVVDLKGRLRLVV